MLPKAHLTSHSRMSGSRSVITPLWLSRSCKEIQPVHPKGDQSWVFIGRIDAEAETPVLWPPCAKSWLIGKRPWCWEGLGAGGEGGDRGWDGWMASPTLWAWVWVNFGSWWWTGRPGTLRFMGLQRVGHDWATEPTDWPSMLNQPLKWHMCLEAPGFTLDAWKCACVYL